MASTRLLECFKALQSQGRKALIPYVTAGDPAPDETVSLMHTLVASGADVIELGVPFSDPMADGPVIQRSSERALARGVSLSNCLDWVKTFRQADTKTPVVLMGYANPIERMGVDVFVSKASQVGVDGVLVVDYPPEESEAFASALRKHDLDPIFLLAPTSSLERIQKVASLAAGYLYYVSLKGVTGAGHLDVNQVAQKLESIRSFTRLPLGVGFGISGPESAVSVGQLADAVVIGSALIRTMEEAAQQGRDTLEAARGFLNPIRQALDAAA
ncbi:MAG: tryptophan synthase subunit alpha [Burkholderiaceae bacterium]